MVTIGPLAMAVLAAAIVAIPSTADAHPLHTTLTEVSVDATSHSVHLVVRVFADDLGAALARRAHLPSVPAGRAWDDAASSYVVSVVAIADRGNRAVALRSCGTRRSGDLLWICLEGTTLEAAQELRGRNAMLCDLFDDQVNIVQFVTGAQKHSVLFTRGDGLKRLAS